MIADFIIGMLLNVVTPLLWIYSKDESHGE